MDSFEQIVRGILERDGFWVRSCYKVNLSKEEKVSIGRPSCPRWEIDLIAYRAASNELRLVECKSYLDSVGVQYRSLIGENGAERYKLFTDPSLRDVIVKRLIHDLVETGTCLPAPKVTFCLAAGKVKSETDRQNLRSYFEKNEWLFWDDAWIKDALLKSSLGSYENDVALVVTKLLLR